MRLALIASALILPLSLVASADPNRDRGNAAAKNVTSKWGSPDAFKNNAMMPLASGEQMSTIDGSQRFGAKIGCEGAKSFMKLTLVPSNTGDIQSMPVSLDSNFDGTPDQNTVLQGPFAAMCDNGMIRCTAGSMNNCAYFGWKVDSNGLSLNPNNASGQPNTIRDMGACYCFNNSCGNGLLLQNAEKILDDAGGGIALAMTQNVPRFALASKTMLDTTTAEYYGQTSGCGVDDRPEQYYKNMGGLEAKGGEKRSDPNNLYNKILTSDNAKGHNTSDQTCQINRNITTANYDNNSALVVSASAGTSVTSCGQGCIRINMASGRLRAGCGLWTATADVQVNRPDLVTSASIDNVSFDDWLRVRVNGAIRWNADNGWTGEGARCGENNSRGSRTLNIDIGAQFKNAQPGSNVQLRTDLSYADVGTAASQWTIQYKQDCQLQSETISNGCSTQENSSQCRLRNERVDSTETYRNYQRTGLVPIAQTRTYTVNGCSNTYTRDYFQKQRTYTCEASSLPYDGEAAERRYNSINRSFDTTNGSFTDTRYENGAYVTSSQQFNPLPPKETLASCPMVCRTKKARPGIAVGEPGPVNQLNPNGVANDFTWKECSEANVCPLDAGETLVTGCGCRNNFGEAAAAMQSIRQVSQDTLCQAQ